MALARTTPTTARSNDPPGAPCRRSIVWRCHSGTPRTAGLEGGTLPPAVGYAQVAFAIAAVGIVGAMRRRVAGELDPQRRTSLLIAGWAVGEGAALLEPRFLLARARANGSVRARGHGQSVRDAAA